MKQKIFLVFCLCAAAWMAALAQSPTEGDYVISDTFRPGFGEPVGRIVLTQGEVLIFHAKEIQGL